MNKTTVVSARLRALWWVTEVVKDGRSVNEILARATHSNEQTVKIEDSAFAKQLLFGSLRYYHQLKAILDQLLEKPLKQKDSDVYVILLLGVYQLRYLSVPDHAALSESVELTRKIKKPWASALVNGVLRNYQRRVSVIEKKLSEAKTFQFSHPNWIINQLIKDWNEQSQSILIENNQQAPMVIRVNQQKVLLSEYLEALKQVDISAKCHPIARDALVLDSACDVMKLPGFEKGLVSVQDAAPQLVVDLLDLKEHQKVLDGCAAPGGKTTHILQRQTDCQLTSVEMSSTRLKKIEQTLSRLGYQQNQNITLVNEDILLTDKWWDGELFDRILIDVPCSASGVIRRNPDIKIHRKKQDLINIVQLQAEILLKAWSLLKPGGRLVYATCSIFKDENEKQIQAFVNSNQADVAFLPAGQHEQLKKHSQLGYQIFPGECQMDGFYLCGLIKPQ